MQTNKVIVFFEFDKFSLSSNQVIKLENFIVATQKKKNKKILIEGHTDTMGTKYYNENLSKKRVRFYKKVFMDRNLTNNIETKAYGEKSCLIETSDEIKTKS